MWRIRIPKESSVVCKEVKFTLNSTQIVKFYLFDDFVLAVSLGVSLYTKKEFEQYIKELKLVTSMVGKFEEREYYVSIPEGLRGINRFVVSDNYEDGYFTLVGMNV
jgi:hypothetical protein